MSCAIPGNPQLSGAWDMIKELEDMGTPNILPTSQSITDSYDEPVNLRADVSEFSPQKIAQSIKDPSPITETKNDWVI